MKRKRIAAALFALLALSLSAYALAEDTVSPRKGVAVAAPAEETGVVPMFKEASEDSEVLMEYYSGALLDVISLTGTGMAKVQCGEKGASLMGYMREGDLRYGAQAMRDTPRCFMNIELMQGVAVRAYPDGRAPELAQLGDWETFAAISRNADKWVQLDVEPRYFTYERTEFAAGFDHGFVQLPTGTAKGEFRRSADPYCVLPVEGELSWEEAYERGIALALANLDAIQRDFPQGTTEEDLHALSCQGWLSYDVQSGEAFWNLSYFDAQQIDTDFNLMMTAQGELVELTLGNG